MSELKSQIALLQGLSYVEYREVYLKSEADKVIAELKSDIADLRDDKKLTDAILDERNAEIAELKKEKDYAIEHTTEAIEAQERELRHHKYKRCLAMARICLELSPRTASLRYDKKSDLFINFYDWWYKRWLELAEKLKEAK